MHEFELIARLKPLLPTNDFVVAGAGDDCAVLDLGDPGFHTLLKTDAVVEGVHFLADADPEKVGHKAMARALSDIAAMGGIPTAAVVTLALPPKHDPVWVEALYRGMGRTAARFQVAIVGGETTTNPGQILVSIALIGRVPRTQTLRRSGSMVGDAILVSGELGGSIAGRHLEFEPRLPQGQWLASTGKVHAMIDISDGLAGDLRHLLEMGGNLGAELLGSAIPISRTAKLRAREGELAKPAMIAALTDGEDFELLFTVAARDAVPVMDGWRERFPDVRLSCIGRITGGPSAIIRDRHGVRELPPRGYEHFGH